MLTVRIAPNEYQRGPGIIREVGEFASRFGRKALIVGGKRALEAAFEPSANSLRRSGMEYQVSLFEGFCSRNNIDRFHGELEKFDVMIAAGGGRVMDCVKAASNAAHKPLITIPTIAATCAALTPLSVLYNEEGVYESVMEYSDAPRLILVDPEIIVRAPVRYLAAGIGDSLAKWHEISLNITTIPQLELATTMSHHLAGLCNRILLEKGPAAVEANRKHIINKEFEEIVDTILLQVGVISGLAGEAARLAVGHAIYNNLSHFRSADGYLHGEKVAFGLAVQQVLQGKPEREIIDFLKFLKSLELPISLPELGISGADQTERLIDLVAGEQTISNGPFDGSREKIKQAFLTVERLADHILV